MNKINVVDLFAGAGGLSYGFYHDEAFNIVCANELKYDMAQTYKLNHPDIKMYNKDIKDFSIIDLQNDFNILSEEIDLVIGGPPCQSYSTAGKRLMDDPRGKLFKEYYRILKELNPKMFLFENVRGLLSMDNGKLIDTIISLFESLGYKVKYNLLNSADFGVPQKRKRVIIIGSKLPFEFKFPNPTHSDDITSGLLPYLTIEDAIGDLPFIAANESSDKYATPPKNDFQRYMRRNSNNKLTEHKSSKHKQELIALMEKLPEGGSPDDVPEEFRPKKRFGNSHSRLYWNKPYATLTRYFGNPGSYRCIHPKANRALTTREGARIQCFPDDYIFYGSISSKNLQIANAVPCLLSVVLKDSIKEYFHANICTESQ